MTTAAKISCMIGNLHILFDGFVATQEDIDAYERILRDRRALLENDKGRIVWYEYDGHCLKESK